jgi:hypothetical protein
MEGKRAGPRRRKRTGNLGLIGSGRGGLRPRFAWVHYILPGFMVNLGESILSSLMPGPMAPTFPVK